MESVQQSLKPDLVEEIFKFGKATMTWDPEIQWCGPIHSGFSDVYALSHLNLEPILLCCEATMLWEEEKVKFDLQHTDGKTPKQPVLASICVKFIDILEMTNQYIIIAPANAVIGR
jgi:hypothetical protein